MNVVKMNAKYVTSLKKKRKEKHTVGIMKVGLMRRLIY